MDEQIIAKQFTRVPRRPQSVAKDGFQEQVLKTIGGQHFAKTLDISPVSIEYGTVTLKMPVQPKIFQQLGYVHGGAITALLDTATGMCSVTLLGPDESALTSELKVNFLGPGKTFCAHAPGAVEPLGSAIKYFREEFEAGVGATAPQPPVAAHAV